MTQKELGLPQENEEKKRESKPFIWDELMVIHEQKRGVTAAFIDVVVGDRPIDLPVGQKRRYFLARHIAQLLCQRYKLDGKKRLPEKRDKGYMLGCKAGEIACLSFYSEKSLELLETI